MTLLELLWTFFYIGLFTIGGGQVAITLMYEPLVGGGLISGEQFYNMVAVSESTPGPIGINMATYIGCELYGVMGGILVTFATVLPSLVIIIVIAKFFDKYQEKPLVKSVFTCIRPVSAGLIAVAAYEVLKISLIQPFSFVRLGIYLVAFSLLMIKKMSPIFVMILGAVAGILFL
ncbi:MAG: chromate transporter [Spirochaetaceae bacterium]|nr:chromate transporter [Spirochaetaceae bacterium]MBQ4554733.1 chromate transporter [Spirochaetaceae bacterium]